MKRFLIFVAMVILVVFLISRWNEQRRPAPETFTPAPKLQLERLDVLAAMDAEYTKLVEAVIPSVVSLTTSRTVQQRPYGMSPWERFFGDMMPRRALVQNSLGSGVIVSKEGHILTNNHVVAKMDEIKVHLRDGREFPAIMVGGDEASDIAVLKINASNLQPLAMGDSDHVKVGSLVLAVGNPFGLQETVTHGMISATNRQIADLSGLEFFQTDTAINPGNSGGPLINMRGEIIAINTAIGNYSGSGTWQGVGFAIPINTARFSMESILKKGRVVRGYLGIEARELTPELAEQEGIPGAQGVQVGGVASTSPAEKAGLKAGDVITELDGKPIRSLQELLRAIAAIEVGRTVEIGFLRQGEPQKAKVTIEEQPLNFHNQVPGRPGAPTLPPGPGQVPQPDTNQGNQGNPRNQRNQGGVEPGNPLYGIRVAAIPASQRRLYPDNVAGVQVTGMAAEAPAAGVLKAGDVIEEVGRVPVQTPEEFYQLATQIEPGQRVMLSIARGKTRLYVVILSE